jgi:outer membrane protein assembly factor BamB
MVAGALVLATTMLGLSGAGGSVPSGAGTSRSSAGASGFGSTWTVYHGSPLGTGIDPAGTDLDPLRPAWASPALDGALFGEPLVYAGRVYAATENDTVYALAADTGKVIWSTHVGPPVPAGEICDGDGGDIKPTVGITGTPVVDPARQEIFVVADEAAGGSTASHHVIGLDVYTGRIDLDEVVNPPGSTATDLLQRPGLTLDDGQVILGFGGNTGDCGNYHGGIAAVPEAGGPPRYYLLDTAPGQREGAVWMGGGAPAVDAAGDVWFAVGNGSQTAPPYDYSDSVTEVTAALDREQYFAPASWESDNATDFDLGSAAPAFVDGYVFQVGKSHIAYLLDPQHLGGIGGSGGGLVASTALCSGDPHGGFAVDASVVYVACHEGVTAVRVSTSSPHLTILWTAATATDGKTVDGPPIVAGGLVWSIDQAGNMWGLDPSSGATVVSELTNAGEANHFPTPSVADGLLLAPTTDQVFAYEGPAGLPPAPAPVPPETQYRLSSAAGVVSSFGGARSYGSVPTRLNAPVVGMASTPGGGGYWLVAADGGVFAFGDARFYGSMGARHLNEPIVGMAPSADGKGYWLVASDGGIFAFGDARYRGSMGARHLNEPIVGMAPSADGKGYWLVASDGGIFAFGVPFMGSAAASHLGSPVVGIAADPLTDGYWLAAADGAVLALGAPAEGPEGGAPQTPPVVAIAAAPDGKGYWLLDRGGQVEGAGSAVASGGGVAGAEVAIAGVG